MPDLSKIANQACAHVQGINISAFDMTIGGTVQELTVKYRDSERPIRFLQEDLQTQTEEWLLDDIIGQFEKFKAHVDQIHSEA